MSLGLGSIVASTLEVAPWLMAISRQKNLIFLAVGALLAFNYWLAIARPKTLNCAPGDICHIDSPMSRFNRAMFWTSFAIYVVAVSATYGAEWWQRSQS